MGGILANHQLIRNGWGWPAQADFERVERAANGFISNRSRTFRLQLKMSKDAINLNPAIEHRAPEHQRRRQDVKSKQRNTFG
jgi:hypothetical protein